MLQGVLELMAGRVDHWLLADLPGPRGLSAEALAEKVREVKEGADIRCFPTPAEAYAAAQELVAEDDRIVVFGSFLTVSDVLAAIKAARRG
jgi:dihydrofolate synthase/folylpolyglutamate synthase